MMKRIMDIILSGALLLILLPVFCVIAIISLAVLGIPVLFRQNRPGLGGKPFAMFKFRTMLNSTDASGALLEDKLRLGRYGRFLRATSLDELPELWNVFKGDMSLVGPRPLLMEYLPLYTIFQARRHEVRPGITGWAQVNGRNALSWDEKFTLDVYYVDHGSMILDLKILLLTILSVVRRDGVSAQDHATMPPFRGSLLKPDVRR
jgi:sugar transferase EpsL